MMTIAHHTAYESRARTHAHRTQASTSYRIGLTITRSTLFDHFTYTAYNEDQEHALVCVFVAGVIELSSGNLWRHQIIIIISLYRKMTALYTPKVGAWHHHHHLWMVKTVLAGTQPQHCQQTKCVIEMRNGGRLAGCFMVYDGASEHFVCHFSVANAEPDYLRCVSWPCMYIAQCTRTRRASRFICIYIFP